MPRGGKRPGAGRKTSSLTIKSQAIAQIAIEEGITPLQVMLSVMRRYANSQQWDRAAAIAKDATIPASETHISRRHYPGSSEKRAGLSALTNEELEVLERLTNKIQSNVPD